jgi:hypothetical protein
MKSDFSYWLPVYQRFLNFCRKKDKVPNSSDETMTHPNTDAMMGVLGSERMALVLSNISKYRS